MVCPRARPLPRRRHPLRNPWTLLQCTSDMQRARRWPNGLLRILRRTRFAEFCAEVYGIALMMPPGRLVLAPMHGVADALLREVLTDIGGYDWSVTEFVRVTGMCLPRKTFLRACPELTQGGKTRAGTPVRVQLLGSSPEWLAENAAAVGALGPFGIDLNFGCPAPTVNRHRGGAALLREPELLRDILRAVRAATPASVMVSAKMRLGIDDTDWAIACAQGLEAGGAQELVVHARTKADLYRPPARWPWIAQIQEAVGIPVIGNGDVFAVDDYVRLRQTTGCIDVMIGRGAVADPFLAQRLRGLRHRAPLEAEWSELFPHLAHYWSLVKQHMKLEQAPGRLKMWLSPMRKTFAGARRLFDDVRLLTALEAIDAVMHLHQQSVQCANGADFAAART